MNINFKDMITAIALCLLIMMGWQWYQQKYHPQPDQPAPPARQQNDGDGKTDSKRQAGTSSQEGKSGTGEDSMAQDQKDAGTWRVMPAEADCNDVVFGERIAREKGYKAQITINPKNAALQEVRLSEHKNKVTDKETGYTLIQPCFDQMKNPRYALELGKLKLKGRQEVFNLSSGCWRERSPESDGTDRQSVEFVATITDGAGKAMLDVVKTYRYGADNYQMDFKIRLENYSDNEIELESLVFFGPMGLVREAPRSDQRRVVASFWEGEDELTVKHTNLTSFADSQDAQDALVEKPKLASLKWFATANKFFAAVVRPVNAEEQAVDIVADNQVKGLALFYKDDTAKSGLRETVGAVVSLTSENPIAQKGQVDFAFEVYLGPIDRDIFSQPQYAGMYYQKLLSARSCSFCAFDWLTALLLKMMKGTYLIVGNYGVAIIILVLMVRLVMHPISKKSQVNMMKMGKIGPKMEELKKKYGDDKKEFQKRQMELMKEQGMAGNMLLGCLPMLLQMPIWIALYTAVDANIAVRHHGLFPASWHWLTDLSAPDRLIPFSLFGVTEPIQIPLIGGLIGGLDAFNLLPILLTLAMFLQMKYSPQSKMSASTNPQSAQQQKMMMYMMPVMMLLFFYGAPSGLNLYIMSSTFGGLIEQHFIRKHLKEQDAKEAQVKVATTGKIGDRLGTKKRKAKPPKKYF